jgi:hypothetical protein
MKIDPILQSRPVCLQLLLLQTLRHQKRASPDISLFTEAAWRNVLVSSLLYILYKSAPLQHTVLTIFIYCSSVRLHPSAYIRTAEVAISEVRRLYLSVIADVSLAQNLSVSPTIER